MSNYSKVEAISPSSGTSAISPSMQEDTSYALAVTVAQAADDRKGVDIALLGVSEVSYLADYFVIVTGLSNPQVRAISQSIQDKVETEWQRTPLRIEGQADGSWIVLDYGDVIAHIFMPQEREFYNLEAFWGHADRIRFPVSS
ncbi:ribosome silencing factor [Oculatella sp. LEGE 06141]|uniref:ribosome silencing factor n=1 Tax=Oculatella sp. LEGE 06141 TaxID=1828648 RepID=UPI001882603B|nr:ribosome silencing factor [Oculatella sp. LEGE 06141]